MHIKSEFDRCGYVCLFSHRGQNIYTYIYQKDVDIVDTTMENNGGNSSKAIIKNEAPNSMDQSETV